MLIIVIIVLGFLEICTFPFPGVSASESRIHIKNSKKNFSNQTIIKHGIPNTGIFTNESSTHNYLLENLVKNQVVYFSITPEPPFSKSDFLVGLFKHSGLDYSSILYENLGLAKYMGSWTTPSGEEDWILQVNDTRVQSNENFTYTILVSKPENGYCDNTAIPLNELDIVANFTLNHEVHYWQVSLKENQKGTIFINETTDFTLVGAELAVYSQQSAPTTQQNPQFPDPHNPVLPLTEISGSYSYSWNAFITDTYFIVVKHKVHVDSPTGTYNISFSAEQSLYNFDTAGRLPHNQTVTVLVDQSFTMPKAYYFMFEVNLTRADVNIQVYSSTILDYALVKIYDEGRQNPIRSEREELQPYDGLINISLTLDEGYYFLVITPGLYAGKGEFLIHFEYKLARPFVWNPFAILLNIGILAALPVYLIYLDSKGKWYRVNQWSVPTSLQDTYKYFTRSFRGIFNVKEVPNKSILIRVTSIPFKTFGLLNFIESSENETLVILKRLHRRIEWLNYILISIVLYDILNLLSFSFFSIHFLPIYFSNSTILFLILAIPTALVGIIVLFVNVSSYISYNQVVNRIAYSVQNYQKSSDNGFNRKDFDPDQAPKNINYVRVLWNQAKHAFKANNFELFVIKADASVKNLLSTRFQQLVSNPISKPDFQLQVATLRKQGFDLPSEKKIAHFRNLRNRIVHSSFTLDEKESVDCFAYYSTFITRLGLRSS